jgi:kinesin family protein 2/24
MENFYMDNLDRFKTLLAKYVPEPEKKDSKLQTRPNPDMVVCSRVRPLSEEELEAGIPDCVLPRPKKTNMVDAHDLRQPPRGKPLLKVRREP